MRDRPCDRASRGSRESRGLTVGVRARLVLQELTYPSRPGRLRTVPRLQPNQPTRRFSGTVSGQICLEFIVSSPRLRWAQGPEPTAS